jgi:formylglycine-generating enzyme required for sulfatase activity
MLIGSYTSSYALVIGESKYPEGWSDIASVDADVEYVSSALEDQGFIVVVKKDLSSAAFKAAYEKFIEKYGHEEDARLLFYYVGHADKGCIIPTDTPSPGKDPVGFAKKAIPMESFETWAKTLTAKHALFVFDSCVSGSLFSPAAETAVDSVKLMDVSRLFITAAPSEAGMPERSVFRDHFLIGIGGEADLNGDGCVRGTELGAYLSDTVKKSTRNGQLPGCYKLRDQRFSGGDFLFSVPAEQPPSIGSMVFVRGGRFWMGEAIDLRRGLTMPDNPLTSVQLSSFLICRYEVTKDEYFGLKEGPFQPKRGGRPAYQMTWFEAVEFCNKLSEREGLQKVYTITDKNVTADFAATGFRLPTEAEWEYAARGGQAWKSQNFTYSGSDASDDVAWHTENSGDSPHPVGQKAPNALDLYDMSGNLWEWCWDWYQEDYYKGRRAYLLIDKYHVIDPPGPEEGGYRVKRGGGYRHVERNARTVYRFRWFPERSSNDCGFRVLRRF